MEITPAQADPMAGSPAAVGPHARRAALVASLHRRFVQASASDDAAAKQALFKEAVYLGIQPGEFS